MIKDLSSDTYLITSIVACIGEGLEIRDIPPHANQFFAICAQVMDIGPSFAGQVVLVVSWGNASSL